MGKIERGHTAGTFIRIDATKARLRAEPSREDEPNSEYALHSQGSQALPHLGNIGSGALRALYNLHDFNGFRSPFLPGNMA